MRQVAWFSKVLWAAVFLTVALAVVIGYTTKGAGRKLDIPTDKNVRFSGPLVTSADGAVGLSLRYPDRDTGESRTTAPVTLPVKKGASEADKQKAVVAQLKAWAAAYNTLAVNLAPIPDTFAQPHCDDCGGGCSYVVLPGRSLDFGGACHPCLAPYNCNVAVYYCSPDQAPTCNP